MKINADTRGKTPLKVGVIVWTIDQEDNNRYLLRHNKPFDGYQDEWTIVFGDVDEGESIEDAAIRETMEEFSIKDYVQVRNLDYEIEYVGKKGKTVIKFFDIKVSDLDIQITLNRESIGYDWMLHEDVVKVMKHSDEAKAFDKLIDLNQK